MTARLQEYVRNCVNTVGERTAAAADLRALMARCEKAEKRASRLEAFIVEQMECGIIDGELYAEATLVIGFDPEVVAAETAALEREEGGQR